ncbi:substrate-binding domain-containing protein [Enterovibrio sp. ZSDZ35]|uniref:Substrate-binding domain-containing protein n=1 Tax=Enterovibrio qingdaonensis TaxID=2899818 RepID=A0ABT5QQ67_9GAMM|nr:substrate-binding domain-containing protein [Enterovibrio sp. ZSDZ35]MDD1783132.1 substrate-binding domain-containing protein [Enterovibrio sp. ZSDZ35]
MATIKDVAKLAGVSVATVSRVINQSPQTRTETVETVKRAMRKLGYRPNAAARTLVNKKSKAIGVVVADVSDPFFGGLVKHVDNVAFNHGQQLLIGNGYHDAERERQAIELLIENQVGAFIIHSKALDDTTLKMFAEDYPAMVFINRCIPGLEPRCIYLDNYRGAFLAANHLISHGHKNIGCISSNHNIEDSWQRTRGYIDALDASGLSQHATQNLIVKRSPNEKGGEQAMLALLDTQPNITAVCCYNDNMAAGAITALTDNGYKVPEDISVIGFDDSLIAQYLHPKLTTVRYPIEEMAGQAAELAFSLAQHIENHTINGGYKPSLVLRDSVKNLFS